MKTSHAEIIIQTAAIILLSVLAGIAAEFISRKSSLRGKYKIPEQPLNAGKHAAIFAGCAVVMVWIFQSTLNIWDFTDDLYISCISNSVYAQENYCRYINPLLSKLVSLINIVLPRADGKVLLLELLVLTGLWCMFYITSGTFSLKNSVVFLLFVIAMNNKLNLLHKPYTAMTCEFAVFGFFILYAVFFKKADRKFIVAGTVLLSFSTLLRFRASLIIIPFALLILLTDIAAAKKNDRKKMLSELVVLFLPAIILSSIFIGTKAFVDSSEKYSGGIEFDNNRQLLVDYPKKTYEQCREEFEKAGISENDFKAAKAMILADTENVTAEYLKTINQISEMSLSDRVERMGSMGLTNILGTISYSVLLQALLTVFLLAAFLLSDLPLIQKAKLLLGCAGGAVIYIYFFFMGRLPEYVTQAILFNIYLVFLTTAVSNDIRFRYGGGVLRKTAFCAAVCMMVLFCSGIDLSPENSSLSARDSEISEFTEDESGRDEDAVYIWGVYDFSRIMNDSLFMKKNKLLSQEFIEHNLVDGEWMYSQPYYLEYLHRIGMENPMKALTDREKTYYVANGERCEMILDYLREHFDENITVDAAGELCGLPVWKFSKRQ